MSRGRFPGGSVFDTFPGLEEKLWVCFLPSEAHKSFLITRLLLNPCRQQPGQPHQQVLREHRLLRERPFTQTASRGQQYHRWRRWRGAVHQVRPAGPHLAADGQHGRQGHDDVSAACQVRLGSKTRPASGCRQLELCFQVDRLCFSNRDIETVLREDREALRSMQKHQPRFTEEQKRELSQVHPWIRTGRLPRAINISVSAPEICRLWL